MSQHYATSLYKGKPVTILAGWDRPLQQFFLMVEYDRTQRFAFDSLDTPEGGFRSIDGVKAKLTELGIAVPAGMLEEIAADGAVNMGNKVKKWGAA